MATANPVRVTHIVFDLDGGGLESVVLAIARHFANSPIQTSIITLGGREGRVGAIARQFVHQYHVLRPPRVISMLLPLDVARRVRETRADVVHVHSGSWLKGARAARLGGARRVIFTEHGREHNDPPLARWLDRMASRSTDTVVAVSQRLEKYMAQVVGVDPRKIVTVANGVDTDAFTPDGTPSPLRRLLGIPGNALVIGSMGRLHPVKGYDNLIEGFARLRDKFRVRPLYLVIFGEGHERAALEAVVQKHSLREVALLPGWTVEALDAYRLFDIFALTSHSEGMSMSLLEAMATGCAPVVTDVGANAELLGDELRSQVVPAGDIDAFVNVAETTLLSDEGRQKIGRHVRQRVVQRYSLAMMLAQYERLYRGEKPLSY